MALGQAIAGQSLDRHLVRMNSIKLSYGLIPVGHGVPGGGAGMSHVHGPLQNSHSGRGAGATGGWA